ncbi:DUF4136 domain-containing protein [Stutzerimonas azotifigens]|uniref:DUF4136 domain-containing protein n=1 Tax=Stutzerimonas azotifigens TaxID=291995 RepID=UPI000412C545|nr:DUF4136 domain-containing protein [Stutzerimonas azotifigens]
MHRLIAVILLGLGLAACQSHNPYEPEAAPIPPAPASLPPASATYPAAPVDFSSYRYWQWRTPPAATGIIGSETLQEIVSGALDQHGLRPAPAGTEQALAISAALRSETRVRQVYDDYGGFSGYYGSGYYGHPGVGLWGSPPLRVRQYQEEVAVVHLEFHDAASGRLLWSNRAEARGGDSQRERQEALREAVRQALEGFPPR